jgi:hypothetical protein
MDDRINGNEADKLGWVAIALTAVFSAFGWFAANRWASAAGDGGQIVTAILRTLFTLLPAAVGFMIANRRQQRVHKSLAKQLGLLKKSLVEFQRVKKVDRLTKVAREAVKNTAGSAKELLDAIQSVDDPRTKERLTERYKYHTNNIATVLSAVMQQMEESGISIYKELNAEESMHVLERDRNNAEKGIEHARQIMESRGIKDGLEQLYLASTKASQLHAELTSLKKLGGPELDS